MTGDSSSPLLRPAAPSGFQSGTSFDFDLDLDFDPSLGLGVALTPPPPLHLRLAPPPDRTTAPRGGSYGIPDRYSRRDSLLSQTSKGSRDSQLVSAPAPRTRSCGSDFALHEGAASAEQPSLTPLKADTLSPDAKPQAVLRTPSSHIRNWASHVLPSAHSTGFFHHGPQSPESPPSRQRSRTGSFRARSSHLIAEILPRATSFRDAGRDEPEPGSDDPKSSPLSFVCRGDTDDSLMSQIDAFPFPPAPSQVHQNATGCFWSPGMPIGPAANAFPRSSRAAILRSASPSPDPRETLSPLMPANTASLTNLQANSARNNVMLPSTRSLPLAQPGRPADAPRAPPSMWTGASGSSQRSNDPKSLRHSRSSGLSHIVHQPYPPSSNPTQRPLPEKPLPELPPATSVAPVSTASVSQSKDGTPRLSLRLSGASGSPSEGWDSWSPPSVRRTGTGTGSALSPSSSMRTRSPPSTYSFAQTESRYSSSTVPTTVVDDSSTHHPCEPRGYHASHPSQASGFSRASSLFPRSRLSIIEHSPGYADDGRTNYDARESEGKQSTKCVTDVPSVVPAVPAVPPGLDVPSAPSMSSVRLPLEEPNSATSSRTLLPGAPPMPVAPSEPKVKAGATGLTRTKSIVRRSKKSTHGASRPPVPARGSMGVPPRAQVAQAAPPAPLPLRSFSSETFHLVRGYKLDNPQLELPKASPVSSASQAPPNHARWSKGMRGFLSSFPKTGPGSGPGGGGGGGEGDSTSSPSPRKASLVPPMPGSASRLRTQSHHVPAALHVDTAAPLPGTGRNADRLRRGSSPSRAPSPLRTPARTPTTAPVPVSARSRRPA